MIDKIKNYVLNNSFMEFDQVNGRTIIFRAEDGINPEPYQPAPEDIKEARRIGKELIKKFDVKASIECIEEHVLLSVKLKK